MKMRSRDSSSISRWYLILAEKSHALDDVERAVHYYEKALKTAMSISLGAGCCRPSEKRRIRDFIEFTDRLLYQAKEEGRDRYRFQFYSK